MQSVLAAYSAKQICSKADTCPFPNEGHALRHWFITAMIVWSSHKDSAASSSIMSCSHSTAASQLFPHTPVLGAMQSSANTLCVVVVATERAALAKLFSCRTCS